MSSQNEEQRLVMNLYQVQLGKLRANAHKRHWAEGLVTTGDLHDGDVRARRLKRAKELFTLVKVEIGELEAELTMATAEGLPQIHGNSLIKAGKIRGEVADCQNLLAMLADVVGQDSPDPTEATDPFGIGVGREPGR